MEAEADGAIAAEAPIHFRTERAQTKSVPFLYIRNVLAVRREENPLPDYSICFFLDIEQLFIFFLFAFWCFYFR